MLFKKVVMNAPDTKTPLIKVTNLSKAYGSIEVLKNLNLTVYPGDRIALLGVNGSGKTTLMETVLGLLPKQEGQIQYFPNRYQFLRQSLPVFQVSDYPAKMRLKTLMYFYQDFYAQSLGVNETLKFIRLLNLLPFLKSRVNLLSFGQKKKVEAALTLSVDSDFYFIDEITAGVDIDARVQIPNMFLERLKSNPKKGMIWITHDPNEIDKLCNRIVLLSRKTRGIYFDGTVAQAKEKFGNIQKMLETHFRTELS